MIPGEHFFRPSPFNIQTHSSHLGSSTSDINQCLQLFECKGIRETHNAISPAGRVTGCALAQLEHYFWCPLGNTLEKISCNCLQSSNQRVNFKQTYLIFAPDYINIFSAVGLSVVCWFLRAELQRQKGKCFKMYSIWGTRWLSW